MLGACSVKLYQALVAIAELLEMENPAAAARRLREHSVREQPPFALHTPSMVHATLASLSCRLLLNTPLCRDPLIDVNS
jgi:hypothetical protein